QGQIATALKSTGEGDGRAAVAKRLLAKESLVRQNAVQLLGLLRGPASVEALTAALKDADPTVRGEAVHALVEAGRVSPGASHLTPEAAGAIVLALDDADRSVETRA